MMETIRLFDEDSHQTLFEGCVLSCEQDGDLYKITLNQTMFFPEEGGQSCDRGTLNDIPVEKVLEKDRVIYHWVKEPLWEGDTVTGCVDWEKRFSDMQQHTGEHIVSGLIHEYFKLNNVGFHLGSEAVTMDFDGVITREQLRMIEHKANEAVAKNLPVKITWPSREELMEIPYRSKKEIDGPIRIVEIPGYDICACCAPHVHFTGEIGMIAGCRLVPSKKVPLAEGVYACPIVKLEADPEVDDEIPALTIYRKREVNIETERKPKTRTTEITADEFYVAVLSNEAKVVLAKFKA